MTIHAKHTQPIKGTTPTNGSVPSYDFLLGANQQFFARWLNGVNALSQEIAQFTQNRLQDDMAAWSTLAKCDSPADAFKCQQRFAQNATEGYMAEVAKLSEMMMSLMRVGSESPQHGAHAVS
jgi:hypothetical protein